jgi:hypothetical protein
VNKTADLDIMTGYSCSGEDEKLGIKEPFLRINKVRLKSVWNRSCIEEKTFHREQVSILINKRLISSLVKIGRTYK